MKIVKIEEAQYLHSISTKAIQLDELIRKSTSILRWVTNKTKKGVTGWRIMIEPEGIDYSYRNSISIKIPRDMGIKEIKALARIIKEEATRRLKELHVDKASVKKGE